MKSPMATVWAVVFRWLVDAKDGCIAVMSAVYVSDGKITRTRPYKTKGLQRRFCPLSTTPLSPHFLSSNPNKRHIEGNG